MTVLRVENLAKRYRLGMLGRRTFFADLRARLRGERPPGIEPAEDAPDAFWALRGVSFEVQEGEVVGILGRNGAGKSTLLKILSQITSPTRGHIYLRGRVASLLEVGTGFHLELTGRDNVFLNGAILGMTRREVAAKFDEIAAFAGIDEFLDTPVKRYSSGMRVRLAFAVAAHLEPEILVIDEVLAVGDAQFQQKCLGKIGDVARSGRTVLFVSHNAAAVESLCTRGIVLERGELKFDGTQSEALAHYAAGTAHSGSDLSARNDRVGSGDVRVVRAELRDAEGRPLASVRSGQEMEVWLFFENRSGRPLPRLHARINVTTALGLPLFTQANGLAKTSFGELPASGALVCRLPALPLAEAGYRIDYYLHSEERRGELLDGPVHAIDLPVERGDFFGTGVLPPTRLGPALVPGEWRMESAAAPASIAAQRG